MQIVPNLGMDFVSGVKPIVNLYIFIFVKWF
jgi:hypothetical protein